MSISKSVVNAVYKRASGGDMTLSSWGPFCEACGGPAGTHQVALHHRLLRSAGGPDTVANLMLVHGGLGTNCHNLTEYSIHQNPERSYRLGHLLRRGQDPELVPFVTVRNLRELRA